MLGNAIKKLFSPPAVPVRRATESPPDIPVVWPSGGGGGNPFHRLVREAVAISNYAVKFDGPTDAFVYIPCRSMVVQVLLTIFRDGDVLAVSPVLRVRHAPEGFPLYLLSRNGTFKNWRMTERGGEATFDCASLWPVAQITPAFLRDMALACAIEHNDVSEWLQNQR